MYFLLSVIPATAGTSISAATVRTSVIPVGVVCRRRTACNRRSVRVTTKRYASKAAVAGIARRIVRRARIAVVAHVAIIPTAATLIARTIMTTIRTTLVATDIATRVPTYSLIAAIPKPTTTAVAVIVATAVSSAGSIQIAHSISKPLVYLRINLIVYYMLFAAFFVTLCAWFRQIKINAFFKLFQYEQLLSNILKTLN